MNKLASLALTLALAVVVTSTFTGCATRATPNTDIHAEHQTLNDVSIILRNAVRSAGAIAIQENPDAAKHVRLVAVVIDTFLIGGNYQPGALVKALEPVVKEFKDVKVALAVNTATDLYEVFYGRYVKDRIAERINAVILLAALRDGALQAYEIAVQP